VIAAKPNTIKNLNIEYNKLFFNMKSGKQHRSGIMAKRARKKQKLNAQLERQKAAARQKALKGLCIVELLLTNINKL
jgi:hypothetical protein